MPRPRYQIPPPTRAPQRVPSYPQVLASTMANKRACVCVTGLYGAADANRAHACPGTRKRLTQCHARSCMFCDSMCVTRLTWGRCRVSAAALQERVR
eukprot:6980609-Prymnesium_polylepis.1